MMGFLFLEKKVASKWLECLCGRRWLEFVIKLKHTESNSDFFTFVCIIESLYMTQISNNLCCENMRLVDALV